MDKVKRKYFREYYHKHKDKYKKILARQSLKDHRNEWNKNHLELMRKVQKDYWKNHPEKYKKCNIIRTQNGKIKSLFMIWYDNRCMECNKKLYTPDIRIHHIKYDLNEINGLINEIHNNNKPYIIEYLNNYNNEEIRKVLEKLKNYVILICRDCHKKKHKEFFKT